MILYARKEKNEVDKLHMLYCVLKKFRHTKNCCDRGDSDLILTYRRKDQQRRTESNASIWIGTTGAVSHNVNLNFSLSLCIR